MNGPLPHLPSRLDRKPTQVPPEWRAEFEDTLYRSAVANTRRLFWAVTVLNVIALIGYDAPIYLAGLQDQYRMYGDLVVFRVLCISSIALWLVFEHRLRDCLTTAQATVMTRITLAIALLVSISHVLLSQTLAMDASIFALVQFFVAGMLVTPNRLKLAFYPVSYALLITGVLLINDSLLVALAICVNTFFIASSAMVADEVWFRAASNNFILRKTLSEERRRSDELLRNILPDPIAERLKRGEGHVVEFHDDVTVLFADVVGFTQLASELSPTRLIHLLESLFKAFDEIAEQHGVEKIKTVGDAYMAAAGVPDALDDHADRIARTALAMVDAAEALGRETGMPLTLRIGIDSGPAISGVIAQKKYAYDLWGDTVNTASRMETSGSVGRIHVSDAFRERLGSRYQFERRGTLEVKGKGFVPSHFLIGHSEARAA
jgi:class 3 adenylate cyclase